MGSFYRVICSTIIMMMIEFVGASTLEGSVQPALPSTKAAVFSAAFGLSCTNTYISPDGYFLTAFHCIESCVSSARAAQFDKWAYFGGHWMPLYRINREKLKSTVCRSTEGLQARIISVGGSGYFATGENYFEASDTNRNEFIKQLDQGYDAIAGAGDFALLKLETRGHKVPCLALTKHSLSSRQRERLTCDGFTMGVEKRVSGQIVPNSSVASEGYQVNRIDPRQEVLSLPVDHGMSGATYLDASGDIAGTIVSRMHSSLNSLARQGVTVAIGIPIEEIVRRLSIDLGSRDAARILNSCRDSRSSESRSTESKQAGEPLGV